MYDCVTNVPLIAWCPKRFKGGRKVDALCQLMDVGPTILDLAEVEEPEWMEAETLMPALQGELFEGREFVIAEHGRDVFLHTIDFVTMIRTKDWKLVQFLDEPFGQLIDLGNDPAEEVNLWDDPKYAEKKMELIDAIGSFRVRSGYQTRKMWETVR